MEQSLDYGLIDQILERNKGDGASIIAILQEIQEKYRYLHRDVFPYLAEKLGVTQAKLYGLATFYENFSLEAKGKYIIKICDGTACHVRKSVPILDRFRSDLKLTEGKTTTDDLLFTVETVSCLGACGLAPVITVNEKVYAAMTPDKATELVNMMKANHVEEGK